MRIVPRVEREEFMNVGVVMYCASTRFLSCLTKLDTDRLRALAPSVDLSEVADYVHSFELICGGNAAGGPIAALPPASRFRWLTATRSTVLQVSRVHPGLCLDPRETLDKIFVQQVL